MSLVAPAVGRTVDRTVVRGIALAAFTLALTHPTLCWAGSATIPMPQTLLVAAAALAIAGVYLALRVLERRFGTRALVMTGPEHLLLGLAIGPATVQAGLVPSVDALLPLGVVLAGWMALSRGIELDVRSVSDPLRGGTRLGIFCAIASALFVAVAATWLFRTPYGAPVPASETWTHGWWLGAAAAATSAASVQLIAQRDPVGERIAPLIRRAARFADVTGVIALGVLFCVAHGPASPLERQLSAIEWAVVALGLGIALGLLFTPFLARAESYAGRVLALAAMVAVASGAVLRLDLSPLWVTLAMGAIMVNATQHGDRLRETVRQTRQPAAMLLWMFAGVIWRPPELVRLTLLVAGGYIALRMAGHALGAWLASRTMPLRADLSRGLVGQGEMALAIGIMARMAFEGPLADAAYSALLLAVLLQELVAPRLARRLLVDAGDLKGAAPVEG